MIDPKQRIKKIQAEQRRAAEESDGPDMALILEAVVVAMANKSEMFKAGEEAREIKCPRCGGRLRFAIIGRNRHMRMACEGKCGMALME